MTCGENVGGNLSCLVIEVMSISSGLILCYTLAGRDAGARMFDRAAGTPAR